MGLNGFETYARQNARRTLIEIERHMEDVLADDLLLAYILAAGRALYRVNFLREFQSFKGLDRQMPELLWRLFLHTWQQRYGGTRPGQYLDAVHIVTPPTDKEIEDAWVWESASSDEARRYYGVP